MMRVLILYQSKSVRNNLHERLKFESYSVHSAESVAQIAGENIAGMFDIIVCDEQFESLPAELAQTPFVVVSSAPNIELALRAAKVGAIDLLSTPIDMNRLLVDLRQRAYDIEHESEHSATLVPKCVNRRSGAVRRGAIDMVGDSPKMQQLKSIISKVAPCDARVLILGENGTGKEMVARSLHYNSPRAAAPFVEVNCAAIPSELIESELFGHEKGAFTSAIKQRKGKFEQAHGGTLFLDEVGDMSLSAQAKVLRALQERKICRVGSDKDIDVDVRVIAATNKDILSEIERGNFREDLYHRLGVIVIKVAPLRDRKADIPMLIDYFMDEICREYHVKKRPIAKEAMGELVSRKWSGNIRELRNVVERLVVLCDNQIVKADIDAYC